MKFIPAELAYLTNEGEMRRNLKALFKFLAFQAAMVAVYTAVFHWIMWNVEGVRHSWITGLYWTLTVMTTLGFGDITFQSDIGRAFTIVVLLSGVVFLLIVLPFAFIRYFYAPWLEARIHQRAPRAAPARLSGHVILCRYDDVARLVIERLVSLGIPYLVLEPDPTAAATLHSVGRAHAHVVGRFKDLLIAEFPVHLTPLAGQTIREVGLRRDFGVNVIGCGTGDGSG